ncbi:hypothetical protein ACFE04_023208 [Oxalis oulophora]
MALNSRDVSAFKFLFGLALMYGLVSVVVHSILHMKFVKPLDIHAPLHRFSEARAIEHVRFLSQEIQGRQEGRPGLRLAADYIKSQLEFLKQRAGPHFRIEIEETVVNGSFNMLFLGHAISLAYRNHTNIIARLSSVHSQDTDPSVMINAHFDSPLGSPGAGDCGTCVASMLEIARLIVDSGWVPPRPIVFLFNGAEELFLLGAHGFMKTHKWADSVGAAINVEASGTGGPDLVCQSGPGSWPSLVYAQSAVYPMAHSTAQDVFPVIPGDTDYRIFSQDYGDIPSLDIIFLFGGYYYHTASDTLDKIVPGSMQARGENLFSILVTFTNSSKLQNASERVSFKADNNEDRAVFFDYLTWFMVIYSKRTSEILHSIPIAIFLALPVILHYLSSGSRSWFAVLCDMVKGIIFHAAGIILAIVFPVLFSILRLQFSSHAMNWLFLHTLLISAMLWEFLKVDQKMQEVSNEARFWGAFGFYAIYTLVYLLAGLSGGFLTFFNCASMLLAWIFYCISVKYNDHRSTFSYIIPLVPYLTYSVYFGGFFIQFLIEKMGMIGAIPPPYGYYVPDVVVAAVVGVVTGWCVGPLIPICGQWLARSSVIKFLLHLTVLALALSSQFFPYSTTAPKRVVFQHTFVTQDGNQVTNSSYDFTVVDSNPLPFLFKYAPEASKELHITSQVSLEASVISQPQIWMGLFPVSFLISKSIKFPARSDDILEQYSYFPHLYSTYKDSQRFYLELSLGSLEEVWVAVLNITGPLSSWSFAENVLPAPETVDGGPPSYVLRLSGSSHQNWTFWLESDGSESLRVDLAVVDQKMTKDANKLKGLFPNWADLTAYSCFLSTYIF